ncbi:MAG: hypothetical protein F6K30_11200 [Cyanothece sp. SIO2G6]|nr:hypothetical protein [Cyanothece sp. SIO2G6]
MVYRSYSHTLVPHQSSPNDLPLNRLPKRSFGLQAKPETTELEPPHQNHRPSSFGHDFTTTSFFPTIRRQEDAEQADDALISDHDNPQDLEASDAQRLGQEALQTVGYERLMAMAVEAGLIEQKSQDASETEVPAKSVESDTKVLRQTMAPPMPTFWGVFSRYAVGAGVASQVDSPAPGPADLVALGILAVGLAHAGYTVLMASPGNQADTGIINEAQALIEAGLAASICAALALLMQSAKAARDKTKIQRIKKTQKAKGCRHSRHS